jgi:negative regulator of genetic competence, sporulation and motility
VEYLLINERKLKITLSAEDLSAYGVSACELDYSGKASRGVIESLLARASEELGFDSSGHRLLLQLFPLRDGSCELFVSLLDRDTVSAVSEREDLPRAFSFDSSAHLIAACRRLIGLEALTESSAWVDGNDRWFLLLSLSPKMGDPSERLGFMSEYGDSELPSSARLYLDEHATAVCPENAVQLLGSI